MADKTAEEIEAETKALEEQLAAINAKRKPKPVAKPKQPAKPVREGDTLRAIQADQRVKTGYRGVGIEELSARYGHTNGPTLIHKIEAAMDKRRKIMEDMVVKHGLQDCLLSTVYVSNKGRYEGLAGALAILRSSNIRHEMARSDSRLGFGDEEANSTNDEG